jgi:hypothetical protein
MTNPNDQIGDVDYMSSGGHVHGKYSELTKREYFAAMAMFAAARCYDPEESDWTVIPGNDVVMADALIAELNKPHD